MFSKLLLSYRNTSESLGEMLNTGNMFSFPIENTMTKKEHYLFTLINVKNIFDCAIIMSTACTRSMLLLIYRNTILDQSVHIFALC